MMIIKEDANGTPQSYQLSTWGGDRGEPCTRGSSFSDAFRGGGRSTIMNIECRNGCDDLGACYVPPISPSGETLSAAQGPCVCRVSMSGCVTTMTMALSRELCTASDSRMTIRNLVACLILVTVLFTPLLWKSIRLITSRRR